MMGHDVFLSYSTKDKVAAESVCAALERGGVNVWMAPRDIAPGASWAGAIVEAIDNAGAVVLIFSGVANDSSQIEREVQRALDKNLRVIPFRIEDVKPKEALAYCIGAVQWLDAFIPPMSPHYEELLKVVRRIAPPEASPTQSGGPPAVPPPPPPQRSQRIFAILAAVVGLLVVSGLVAWQWPKPEPAPNPSPARPDGSGEKPIVQPAQPPDKTSERQADSSSSTNQPNSSNVGNFGIVFGTESDPKSAMNEINTARKFPNSPRPILYRKNGQWMSIVTFDTPSEREQLLPTFKAKFPKADPKPLQLSSVCPNPRLISAETPDMAEQRDCGSS
jgi:TIR domain